MLTVLEIVTKTTEFFSGKGIESPRLQAELLVGHTLGLKRMQLYLQFERPLAESELEKLRPLVRRRAQREPLQYVLGEVEFLGLKLKVDRRALIPRPETELMVDTIKNLLATNAPRRVLDLGTGSGAIALSLARAFPTAEVVGAEVSADALMLAEENGVSTGLSARVRWVKSNWFSAISNEAPFDLIVSNPPYLTATEVAEAAPEVRQFEPINALVAADDGLADLRKIIAGAPPLLAPGGLLAMETGIDQHADLLRLAAANRFERTESRKDLAGRDRFVLAWRSR